MELDQLFHDAPDMRERKACMHTFDLGVLRAAFRMSETAAVDLSSAEKGIRTAARKLRNKSSKYKEIKHRKHKHNDENKNKDHKKHRERTGLGP